jgi:hypothetical protein
MSALIDLKSAFDRAAIEIVAIVKALHTHLDRTLGRTP